MTCPRAGAILRLISGELSPREQAALLDHLAACPACASERNAAAQTWDALGAWVADPTDIDLTARVLAQCEALAAATPILPRRAPWRPQIARVAASIVLAAGLGVGAGRLIPIAAHKPPTEGGTPEELLQGVDALGLSGFASESATGLTLGFSADDTAEGDGRT